MQGCPHICIKLVAVFGYHSYQYANELKFTNLRLFSISTVENLVMICSTVAEIWEHSIFDQPISKHGFSNTFS